MFPMIKDPALRAAVIRAYRAWQARQEQLTLFDSEDA